MDLTSCDLRLLTASSDLQSGTESLIVVSSEKYLTDSGSCRVENGKSIVVRDAYILDESPEPPEGVDKRSQAPAVSNRVDTPQASLWNHLHNETKSRKTGEDGALDSSLLQQRFDDVENQIIQLTELYGDIPVEKMMRLKLAALYIVENILTRMLHGMSSQEEALSKTRTLGDLLPGGSYGEARKELLDLWPLSSNEKYFAEEFDKDIATHIFVRDQLKKTVEYLDKAASKLQQTVILLQKAGEMSSSASTDSELLQEKSSWLKDALEFNRAPLGNVREEITGRKASSEGQSFDPSDEVAKPSFELTRLDKKVIVFHHLFQEFTNGTQIRVVNNINIDILENYFARLMSDTELSFYEKGIAYFSFLQTLSLLYVKVASECITIGLGCSAKNSKGMAVKNASVGKTIYYNNILHKMAIACINNGIYRVADYWVLNLLASGFLMNYRYKGSDKSQLALLCSALEMSPKQERECAYVKYTCFTIAEVIEDVEAFERVAEDSSKYNTLALLIMLWNDLGFSRWPYSTTLNPERALAYLEFIQDNIGDKKSQGFKNTKVYFDTIYDYIALMQGNTKGAKLWSERVALYFYISGDPAKASNLLEFGNRRDKKLYHGLAMASKRQYQLAIQFLENGKGKDVPIKALLGILYEKLVSPKSELDEGNADLLRKAELNYQAVIKSRPEMNKNLAIVLENRSDLKNALKHWKVYRSFLDSEAKEDRLRSVRFKLSLEFRLVDEKIADLNRQLEQNKPETDELYHSSSPGFNVEENKPDKKKRLKRKKTTRTDSVAIFNETNSFDRKKEEVSLVQLPTSGLGRKDEMDSDKEGVAYQELGQSDAQWQVVSCKHSPARVSVANKCDIHISLSTKEVKHHWELTRPLRNDLTNRLLRLDFDRGGFDRALAIIDQYLANIENPVARLHFIQNKEWLLRCKSFDKRVLYEQSSHSGKSIQKLKAELQLSVLDNVREQVEDIFMLDCQCMPPPLWFSDPTLLKKGVEHLKEHAHPEFCVQFGAQFSTAAHVMKDIYWELTRERGSSQTCRSLYGHSPDYYFALADKFYDFRDYIDPLHVSDFI